MVENLTPQCLEEACNFAKELGDVKFIAGGTETQTNDKPDYYVNLMALKDLQFVKFSKEEGGKIGAVTPLYNLVKSEAIKNQYEELYIVLNNISKNEKKGRGTLGGKIICMVPEVINELIKLNAKIYIRGSDHEYIIELKQFIKEMKNILDPDEIISEIQIPISI
mgnify:CR=1 FL=1